MMQCRRIALAIVCAATSLGAQSRATGGAGEVPRAASTVINTVMSPYCPGLLLANCPSPAADSLRRALVARAARGESESDLRAALVATYGPGVLAEPPMSGFGSVAWVAPFALVLSGAVLLFRWLRRQRPAAPGGSPASVLRHDPEDTERLQRIARLVRDPT